MASDEDSANPRTGEHAPETWVNNLRYRQRAEATEAHEYRLYSDVWIKGSGVKIGPYELVPVGGPGQGLREAVAVHGFHHLAYAPFDPNNLKTEIGSFHGGDAGDEVAALIALHLGVRFESGGIVRLWGRNERLDGPGRPTVWGSPPSLVTQGISVLPYRAAAYNLDGLDDVLHSYFDASPDAAIAVVRASRLYQKALWVAEADPNQAFIWLVGAIEAAAVQWQGEQSSPLEVFESSLPEVYELLGEHPDLRLAVAENMKDLLKSTRRFISFALKFLPPEPPVRPNEHAQTKWSRTAMRKHLATIYKYRSQALHAGVPFPPPMCAEPRRFSNDDTFAERPEALGYWRQGGEWKKSDLPMNLGTFEYVARNALLAWISSLPPHGRRFSEEE